VLFLIIDNLGNDNRFAVCRIPYACSDSSCCVGVGIGRIGGGKGFYAYRPAIVGEVSNFTDFIPIRLFSTGTVTAKSVGNGDR
jgi:hypothetical protein